MYENCIHRIRATIQDEQKQETTEVNVSTYLRRIKSV